MICLYMLYCLTRRDSLSKVESVICQLKLVVRECEYKRLR
jgi:hypothetical protein